MISNMINWTNKRRYSGRTIKTVSHAIQQNMHGLLPIYGKEKKGLVNIANEYNLSTSQVKSIRNHLRIQSEIYNGKHRKRDTDNIRSEFPHIAALVQKSDDNGHTIIRKFLQKYKQPTAFIINTIRKTDQYHTLPEDAREYIQKILRIIKKKESESNARGKEYELLLQKYLTSLNIEYQTEDDIREEGKYDVTPDILLKEPYTIIVDNKEHIVNWMDAKAFMLINVPYLRQKLTKQATKYNDIFGPGAFVFAEGIDTSVTIPSTLILDGSMIG